MDKIKKLLLMLIIFIPLMVSAKEIEADYEVKSAYISAELDMLGSMHIRELYIVKGAINGYKRILEYKKSSLPEWEEGKINFEGSSIYNGRGISLSKFSAFNIDENEIGWKLFGKDVEKFEETDKANPGDKGVYTTSDTKNGPEVKIYNANESGYIAYYFDYYVNQAVVLHNDVAELYYTFFKLDSDDVEDVEIQVTIPFGCTDETFRVWAHGALNGNLSPISTSKDDKGNIIYKGALATLKDYKMGDAIEMRLTFDKTGFKGVEGVLDNSKMDAFNSIIEVENIRRDKANKSRRIIKTFYYGSIGLSIIYLIGLILLWIHIYRKYDKEYEVDFNHKYYREFTGEYNVEVVDYLMNKNISTNAFTASIMNLIYKKNIDIEENPKDKKNITLKLKNKKDINEAENKLLSLLFETIGKDGKVTLKEVEKFSSKASTAEEFMTAYETWKLEVTNDAKKENFFESHNQVIGIGAVYLLLGIIIAGFLIGFKVEYIVLPILVFIGGISFLIYTCTFKKWTRKGRVHYLKWNAFKNFLKDFGSFKDKELPEIKLWDKYLVYATVLGIAKEVEASMRVHMSNLGTDMGSYPMIFTYNDFYLYNAINKSINTSYTKCVNTINAANASSSMSGSGFGGGFSGGVGGAGGGGGGGGF